MRRGTNGSVMVMDHYTIRPHHSPENFEIIQETFLECALLAAEQVNNLASQEVISGVRLNYTARSLDFQAASEEAAQSFCISFKAARNVEIVIRESEPDEPQFC